MRFIAGTSILIAALMAAPLSSAQDQPADTAVPVSTSVGEPVVETTPPAEVDPAPDVEGEPSLPAEVVPSAGAEAEAVPTEPLVEEVLVTGEQPGPGLWKVSNGEHTLWILGTHEPLPKKMKWRSKQVESLVAHAQEVLTPGSIDFDANIGFFRAMTLMPAALGARKNPNDEKLADLLPPDVYARWLVLKEKYIGRSAGIEKFRPVVAALELRSEAREKSGLTDESVAWPVVQKAARKHKVKVTAPSVKVEVSIDQPRQMLKRFRKVPLSDVGCFTFTIDHLEEDIASLKANANAWASGDIEALERLNSAPPREDCVQMLMTTILNGGDVVDQLGIEEMVERWKSTFINATQDIERQWLAAAEAALTNNQTTVGLLPVAELVRPDGRLAKLRDKGYTIEVP